MRWVPPAPINTTMMAACVSVIHSTIDSIARSVTTMWGAPPSLIQVRKRVTTSTAQTAGRLLVLIGRATVRCLQSSYPGDESNLEPNANDQQHFRQQSSFRAGCTMRRAD